jgi:hypothetical protein
MMTMPSLLLALICWRTHAQYDKNLGRIEKWVMRKAFDDDEHPYLPKVKTATSILIQRSLV